MGIARSTYYHRPKQPCFKEQLKEADLRDRIEEIVVEYPRYGYRRVTQELKREGWTLNHKRVARVMREESLQCQVRRRWVKTTDSNHPYPVSPNLVVWTSRGRAPYPGAQVRAGAAPSL